MCHFKKMSRFHNLLLSTLIVSEQAITLSKGAAYNPTATALDACDGAVTVTRTQEVQTNGEWKAGTVDTKKRGKYRDTFSAKDKSGNEARVVRTITVQ